ARPRPRPSRDVLAGVVGLPRAGLAVLRARRWRDPRRRRGRHLGRAGVAGERRDRGRPGRRGHAARPPGRGHAGGGRDRARAPEPVPRRARLGALTELLVLGCATAIIGAIASAWSP